MKKTISCFSIIILICTFIIYLNGCSKNNEQTVMNLSLNPEVEFILDKENKVVSVNALNEEGNIIISNQEYIGLSANEAVKLFINISKETGFVITGNINTGENELKIALSGDTKQAEKIYNEIDKNLNNFLQDVKVTIKKTEELSIDYLKAKVKESMPELTEEEIDNLSYKKLIDTLIKARKETAKIYSEELKKAFYSAKKITFEQAKLEYLKTQANDIQKSVIDSAIKLYNVAQNALTSARENLFFDSNSLYQIALNQLSEAKINYLNYRNYLANINQEVNSSMQDILENYKTELENANINLKAVYEQAILKINELEENLNKVYNEAIKLIVNSGINIESNLKSITNKANESLKDFSNKFETQHKNLINNSKENINKIKTELKNGYEKK